MAEEESNFRDELEPDSSEYQDNAPDPTQLKASTLINQNLVGVLDDIKEGEAVVKFTCTEDMVVDQKGLIHSGFIFSSANYAAIAAINHQNAILAVSKANFLAPAALNDVITFRAKAMQTEARKRVVEVAGYLQDVKIFEAEFSVVVLERHVLSLHLG